MAKCAAGYKQSEELQTKLSLKDFGPLRESKPNWNSVELFGSPVDHRFNFAHKQHIHRQVFNYLVICRLNDLYFGRIEHDRMPISYLFFYTISL